MLSLPSSALPQLVTLQSLVTKHTDIKIHGNKSLVVTCVKLVLIFMEVQTFIIYSVFLFFI